jgi:protein-S-isoprenylcysteine O-methyltransferase Ste14
MMNTEFGLNSRMEPQTAGRQYRKALLRLPVFLFLIAAVFILSSGRFDWWMAWIYLGLMLVHIVVSMIIIDPDLIEERTKIKKDVKKWDRILVFFMVWIGPLAAWIVSGLDTRNNWTEPMSLSLEILGLGLLVMGHVLGEWALAKNRFFSSMVRIQRDRGHTVITDGPYHYVRHPGYVGAILHGLGTPLVLGSYWAYIPIGFMVLIVVIRTALEDKTLHNELEGYGAYALRTRYRIFPGIW